MSPFLFPMKKVVIENGVVKGFPHYFRYEMPMYNGKNFGLFKSFNLKGNLQGTIHSLEPYINSEQHGAIINFEYKNE